MLVRGVLVVHKLMRTTLALAAVLVLVGILVLVVKAVILVVHPPLVLVVVVVAAAAHLLQILPLHLRVVAVLASLVQALAEPQELTQIQNH